MNHPNTPDSVRVRLQALRDWLDKTGTDAFVVPSTDPHLSEYVAPHWQSREWLSGFTGSAGTLVVTRHDAGLWTDSRYFLQAEQQLQGSGIRLYREMLPETPSIAQYLCGSLKAGQTVGIDGTVFATTAARSLNDALAARGIVLRCTPDPLDTIWTTRPPMPQAPAQVYPLQYAGEPCADKLARVRHELNTLGADGLLLSALDEIAWLLNLRGSDVHCNPVVVSYLYVGREDAHLFIEPGKLTPDVAAYLAANAITAHPYAEAESWLRTLHGCCVLAEPGKTNYALSTALASGCRVLEAASPVALLKAVRNATEVAGLRQAMRRDGVALVRFLMWLEQAVPAGLATEVRAADELHRLRAAQPLFVGDSFDTITGYGPHGAIVHYEATPETDVPLRPQGLLLVDSGAQYLDGTTDVTRTIALGPLTDEEATDYTLVLKGHIALAQAVFPEGTRGAQLDVLARMPLWRGRMNFLHGTGHGVGHFLNVHEGPQSIRMNENPVALRAGMLTSNEPGVYKAGSHGVRTESLLLAVPDGEGMFGRYLRFDTVTLCPVDCRPLRRELLTADETAWLDDYHRRVCDELSPLLTADERQWLHQACRPLSEQPTATRRH